MIIAERFDQNGWINPPNWEMVDLIRGLMSPEVRIGDANPWGSNA